MGIDGRYDYSAALVGSAGPGKLEAIVASLPTVEARFRVKTLPNDLGMAEEEKERVYKAVGVFAGDRYILTIAHFTYFQGLNVNTPFGPMPVPTQVLDKKYFFFISGQEFEMQETKVDKDQDWALFEIPVKARGFCGKRIFAIGRSSELGIGHFLYLVGNPHSEGLLVRSGVVEAVRNPGPKYDIMPAIKPEDLFLLSGGVYPGDSGGPVFALRDGAFELVGLMDGTKLGTTIAWGLKIDPLLEKVKAATGIDLRK